MGKPKDERTIRTRAILGALLIPLTLAGCESEPAESPDSRGAADPGSTADTANGKADSSRTTGPVTPVKTIIYATREEPAHANTRVGSREEFRDLCRAGLAEAVKADESGVYGVKGWIFPKEEMTHMMTRNLPGGEEGAGEVAAGAAAKLESILRFHEELKQREIELIVVPVPPKLSIYPDKLSRGAAPGGVVTEPLRPLLGPLRDAGVKVVDLEPVYHSLRKADDTIKYYCEQDRHWAPEGARTAASLVRHHIAGNQWVLERTPDVFASSEPLEVEFGGDLVNPEAAILPERFSIEAVGHAGPDGRVVPVTPDRGSPVLVLGDSSLLVFHRGGERYHCRGAGMVDYLQRGLGFAIDLEASAASGLTEAREQVARRAAGEGDAFWNGKKSVVWVFSACELTRAR